MKKIILSAVFLFCMIKGNTQSWLKTYGLQDDQTSLNIVQTYDSGFVICGHKLYGALWNYTSSSILIIKTDVNGDTLWTKEIGSLNTFTQAARINKTSDGCFLIIGTTEKYYQSATKKQNAFLLKIDACGEQVWCRLLGDACPSAAGRDVQEYYDGSYLALANYVETENITVFRISPAGDIISRNSYDNTGNPLYFMSPYAVSLLLTNDYGYLLTGAAYVPLPGDTTSGCMYPVLTKIDSSGTQQWVTALGQNPAHGSRSSFQLSDNNYISTGTMGDTLYIYRIDTAGNSYLLQSIYTSPNFDFTQMNKSNDSTFIFLANRPFGVCDTIKFVLFNLNGTVIDQNVIGNNAGIYTSYIEKTFDNKFVITGTLVNGSKDIFYISIDDSLNFSPVNNNPYSYDFLCNFPISYSFYDLDTVGSTTTDFHAMEKIDFLNVYPNPFTNIISITLKKRDLKHLSYTIKNTFGQIIFNYHENNLTGSYNKIINLSSLSNGIYFLDLIINEERIVKKIIKQ